jgi:hypothetical protein
MPAYVPAALYAPPPGTPTYPGMSPAAPASAGTPLYAPPPYAPPEPAPGYGPTGGAGFVPPPYAGAAPGGYGQPSGPPTNLPPSAFLPLPQPSKGRGAFSVFRVLRLLVVLVMLVGGLTKGYTKYVQYEACSYTGGVTAQEAKNMNRQASIAFFKDMSGHARTSAKRIVFNDRLRTALVTVADDLDDARRTMESGEVDTMTDEQRQSLLTRLSTDAKALEHVCDA